MHFFLPEQAKIPAIIVFFCAVPNDTFKNAQIAQKGEYYAS